MGPQALQRFLSTIPGTLPITFIVAQHISASFLGPFTKQLSQYTCFSVEVPKPGHQLQNQQVLIVPEKYDLGFDDNCCLTLLPAVQDYRYNPSIDSIMHTVSKHFGALAGAIIFSGMGEDGTQGCHHFLANGGTRSGLKMPLAVKLVACLIMLAPLGPSVSALLPKNLPEALLICSKIPIPRTARVLRKQQAKFNL